MGVIVKDYVVPAYGLQLPTVYLSTSETPITVARAPGGAGGFIYACSFSVHISKEARLKQQAVISRERIELFVLEPISDNIYTQLYSALKEKFPSAIDDI